MAQLSAVAMVVNLAVLQLAAGGQFPLREMEIVWEPPLSAGPIPSATEGSGHHTQRGKLAITQIAGHLPDSFHLVAFLDALLDSAIPAWIILDVSKNVHPLCDKESKLPIILGEDDPDCQHPGRTSLPFVTHAFLGV